MNRDTKLFVQLQPDEESLAAITAIQRELSASVKIVDEETLHMTVIHIGKASRILDSLRGVTSLSDEEVFGNLEVLGRTYEKEISTHSQPTYPLRQKGFAHFGSDHQTLVMEFFSTPELDALHATCLAHLQSFLSTCGVTDINTFMQHDENLKHALSVRPHVTIAKQSTDAFPPFADSYKYAFTPMPVFYSH